jgi:hypothetical protein
VAEVFISYGRATQAQAGQIAAALKALGYAVWRDEDLPAHRDYSEVIEERLRAAKAVVVIWSSDAVKSQWVRAEAELAREAGTLVQLSLDGAPLPLPFNRIQCADLKGWGGDPQAPAWRKVVASVEALAGPRGEAQDAGGLGPGPAGPPVDRGAAVRQPQRRRRAGILRRRHDRGHHHGAVVLAVVLRHRPQFELHLQGRGGGCAPGGAGARRPLRAGGQRPQGRRARAHHGPAHRLRRRLPHLGPEVRPGPDRPAGPAGRPDRGGGAGDRAGHAAAGRTCASGARRPTTTLRSTASSGACGT